MAEETKNGQVHNDDEVNQQKEPKTEEKQPLQEKSETVNDDNSEIADKLKSAEKEIISYKAQIEAYKAGIAHSAVEDAVLIAVHQAEKSGDMSEKAVSEALKNVLKRHPEWKSSDNKSHGISFGTDSSQKNSDDINKKLSDIFGIKSK